MIIRVGVSRSFGRFCAVAKELGAPVLVSANAFWDKRRFRTSLLHHFKDVDWALDSAGFVALFRYWHFPWALDTYVEFAGAARPTWWAAPDYCCEPEISRNRAEILDRIERTAFKLDWTRQVAADRGVAMPMPVLQGWFADDYMYCADLIDDLPALVGIGSMCRRSVGGKAGVVQIVTALDAKLPAHIKFHLFGVKGQAIRALTGHPRIHSVDSQAWDFAARREKQRHGEETCHVEYKHAHLRRWYTTQRDLQGLFRP